jgi:hypothetical protein
VTVATTHRCDSLAKHSVTYGSRLARTAAAVLLLRPVLMSRQHD